MTGKQRDEVQIPKWLPLNKLENELLAACAKGPLAVPEEKQQTTRLNLFSRHLIRRFEPTEAYHVPKYTITEKGKRALAIQEIMGRIPVPRQPRPIYRYPEGDLSDVLAYLQEIEAAER